MSTTSGRTRPGRDVLDRTLVGWHLAFCLTVGLAEVFVLISRSLTDRERWQATALLATLGVAYLLSLRRAGRPYSSRPAWVYLAVAVVVVGVACAINPYLSMLLFIVFPQTWLFTPTLRWGVVANLALTLSALLGFGSSAGWTEEVFREAVPQMAVSMAFSVMLGFWISRLVEESQRRAELIEQLEQTRSQLAASHHDRGVMAERERMAREIHDTLAQGFTSIVMLAQTAQAEQARQPGPPTARLEAIEAVARENLAEARALVAAFSPVDLEGSTLAAALRRLAERFGAQTHLEVDVDAGADLSGLGRDQEVVLLRAVQEALTNVRRHADARRVSIRLATDPLGARVEVDDDGVGFSAAAATEGFGLAGMRGRVRDVGGQLEVATAPGRGTTVVVRVPLTGGAA
ncbi:MAG: sensor histidine kinase [Kineosporiaceae bacterium]